MKNLIRALTVVIILIASIQNSASVDNIELTRKQTIFLADKEATNQFGKDIVINGDYMAVTEYRWSNTDEGITIGNHVGQVHIYKMNYAENEWESHQILRPDSINRVNLFGLEILFEEDILAIGSTNENKYHEDGDSIIGIGAVYIYRLDAEEETWNLSQKLQPESIYIGAAFGYNIARHKDDLYIGAPNSAYYYEDGTTAQLKGGNVFRYRYNAENGMYEPFGKLTMPDDNGTIVMGSRIAIEKDKLVLGDGTAGVYIPNEMITSNMGRLDYYVYNVDKDEFIHNETILPDDNYQEQFLGYSVFLDNGMLYAFKRRGSIENNQQSRLSFREDIKIFKIRADNSIEFMQTIIPTNLGSIGYTHGRLAISGNILAIGGPTDRMDENGGNEIPWAGSIHIYTRANEDENWVFKKKIVNEPRVLYGSFGFGLDIEGNQLVVSSPNDTIIEKKTGNALAGSTLYVFEIDTTTTSVRAQENKPFTPQITISPNPISDITSIGLPPIGEVRVYLADITGATVREIWTGTADVPTSVMMDATSLSQGEYFVVVESVAGVISEKIVVER